MNAEDDLRKRIEALERENKTLREAPGRPTKANAIVVTEGTYKGHPTITFEVTGRPFTLGVRKAAVVLYCVDHVRSFVSRHKAEIQDREIVRGSDTDGESGDRAELRI
jgi:phosphoenolpyruvate synthase/pyruvate phosphate dikinase